MPFLTLPDTKLHYEIFGQGKPLLFLSATAWHGGVWTLNQTRDLSRDHQVIIFDQRGTGQSTSVGTNFTPDRLAADAVALLDHLDIKRAFFRGHSNGGRVAQLLALDYPNRVDKLILASAGATHHSKGVPLGMCLELVEKGYARYAREHTIETGFTESFIKQHPEDVEVLMREFIDHLTPLEIFLRYVVGRQTSDTTSRLKEIKVPTLVMIGDDEDHGATSDSTYLAFAKILARDIAGAELLIFEGHGHFYLHSAPDKFNQAVRDFLVRR